MTTIHILRRRADMTLKFWCPYCDEVVSFGYQHYYDETWCLECKRIFSEDPKHHQWPKGLDMQTGELEGTENAK